MPASVKSRPLTALGLSVVAAAHLMIVASSVPFFFVTPGSHIRPMGWSVLVFAVFLITLLVVGIISIISKEKTGWSWIVMVAGAFATLLDAWLCLYLAFWLVGFDLSD